MKRFLLLASIFVFSSIIHAQSNRANVWYFGENAGLDFNSGSPTPLLDGQIDKIPVGMFNLPSLEGMATISDTNGNLLFYTDGIRVWDRSHTPMPNASGTNSFSQWNLMLSGNESSTQSAIITPVIGSTDRYYVFTTDGSSNADTKGPLIKWDGLHYTVIDMKLNNGLGDIDTTFIHSLGPIGVNKITLVDSTTEKIAIAKHANGTDYWVTTRLHFKDEIHAFLVTCKGIADTAIISSLNHSYNLPIDGTPAWKEAQLGRGYLKSSKDGKVIVDADVSGSLMLYNFDNDSGHIISEDTLQWLAAPTRTPLTGNYFFGVEFSKDDSTIYATLGKNRNDPAVDSVIIFSFDRHTTDISSSARMVFGDSSSKFNTLVTGIQLAPDGNIYHAVNDKTFISVIKNANSHTNSFYEYGTIDLGGRQGGVGLPSFYFYEDYNYQIPSDQLTICPGEINDIGIENESLLTYSWSPGSTLGDSTISNPQASPNETTTYYLSIGTSEASCVTDSITVILKDTQNVFVDVITDTVICGDSIYNIVPLYNNPASYLWSTGDTFPNLIARESGFYKITIQDSSECNVASDSIQVLFEQSIKVIEANDSIICSGTSIALTAPQWGKDFAWNPSTSFDNSSSRDQMMLPQTSTLISITMTDSFDCIYRDSLYIDVSDCNIFIPNAINLSRSEGFNIQFGSGTEEVLWNIYDIHGEEIFIGTNVNDLWDGTYGGKKVNAGVYVYYLNITYINGEFRSFTGNITIIN